MKFKKYKVLERTQKIKYLNINKNNKNPEIRTPNEKKGIPINDIMKNEGNKTLVSLMRPPIL